MCWVQTRGVNPSQHARCEQQLTVKAQVCWVQTWSVSSKSTYGNAKIAETVNSGEEDERHQQVKDVEW